MLETNFTTSTLGHVFSSVKVISPSENITKRLNSIDQMVLLKATEENVADSIQLCSFEKLIHPTPFKSSPSRRSMPTISRPQQIQIVQKILPLERENPMETQRSRVTQSARAGISRARTLSASRKRSCDSKTPLHGILKTGTKSRFANIDRANSMQSDNSMSRVTIVE